MLALWKQHQITIVLLVVVQTSQNVHCIFIFIVVWVHTHHRCPVIHDTLQVWIRIVYVKFLMLFRFIGLLRCLFDAKVLNWLDGLSSSRESKYRRPEYIEYWYTPKIVLEWFWDGPNKVINVGILDKSVTVFIAFLFVDPNIIAK